LKLFTTSIEKKKTVKISRWSQPLHLPVIEERPVFFIKVCPEDISKSIYITRKILSDYLFSYYKDKTIIKKNAKIIFDICANLFEKLKAHKLLYLVYKFSLIPAMFHLSIFYSYPVVINKDFMKASRCYFFFALQDPIHEDRFIDIINSKRYRKYQREKETKLICKSKRAIKSCLSVEWFDKKTTLIELGFHSLGY